MNGLKSTHCLIFFYKQNVAVIEKTRGETHANSTHAGFKLRGARHYAEFRNVDLKTPFFVLSVLQLHSLMLELSSFLISFSIVTAHYNLVFFMFASLDS